MTHSSMTGFGRGEALGDKYSVTTEVKSVNNRYKDFRFRIPSIFSHLEMGLRKQIEQLFSRGSFEISIHYKHNQENVSYDDLDDKKIANFIKKIESIAKKSDLTISPTDFLRKEFMKDNHDEKVELLTPLLHDSFKKALDALNQSRQEEGAKLIAIIKKHKKEYISHYKTIFPHTDTYQEMIKEKIMQKFETLGETTLVDNQRFLQEVIYYLEKIDIHEELNRIETHSEKLDSLLSGQGEIGRQVDFLIQEFNRETNTIGSKSACSEISNAVVQMKVHIEKIREQALNIE